MAVYDPDWNPEIRFKLSNPLTMLDCALSTLDDALSQACCPGSYTQTHVCSSATAFPAPGGLCFKVLQG